MQGEPPDTRPQGAQPRVNNPLEFPPLVVSQHVVTIQPQSNATDDKSPQGSIDNIPFDYRGFWHLTDKQCPIMITKQYAVFLDAEGDLDWQTTEAFDNELTLRVAPKQLNSVLNQVAILRSYPVEHLTRIQRNNFRMMVGEGLARGFEFDPMSAMEMFQKAGEYATARNQEVARSWYLCATGLTTGLFAVILSFSWNYRVAAIEEYGRPAFCIGFAGCVGALGAFFSTLSRVGRTPLDPSAGWKLHWLEGFGRILIGVLGAAVSLLAVQAGFALTVLSDKGLAGLIVIGFVAGFSERLIHTIIKRVELNPINADGGLGNERPPT
jgi:hypothetical protein